MANFDFDIKAPAVVKKGKSARILLGQLAATGDTVAIHIVDPSGRTIPGQPFVKNSIGGVSGLNCHYADFSFGSAGTYMIFAVITTTAPATTYGFGMVHVPEWTDNIDVPVSNIDKANTEISRLRTLIGRK